MCRLMSVKDLTDAVPIGDDPWIQTFTGLKYEFNHPTPDMIDIKDIAHALSQTPRFGGHCPTFYSVAEHCMNTALLVPDKYKLEALLHDAAEAYIGDIVTPFKRQLGPLMDAYETACNTAIAVKYSLQFPFSSHVRKADKHILYLEAKMLFPEKIEDWHLEYAQDGYDADVDMLFRHPGPKEAEKAFLQMFNDYSRAR